VSEPGLLLDGKLVDVPGVTVIPPVTHGGPAWNLLRSDDFCLRQCAPTIVCLHTTGGLWPQPVIEAAARGGHAREILEMWSGQDRRGGERQHSGASLVVDLDGVAFCAGDIVRTAAYHARAINGRSVGIEMCTMPDGAITRATLHATALIVAALTHSAMPGSGLLAIPALIPSRRYPNAPLRRLEVGGVESDGLGLCGVIGHRDQTAQRGFGDPGDAIWRELSALGFEAVDYDGGEDIERGKRRQAALNVLDAKHGNTNSPLVVDGVCGVASLAAMHRLGFARWQDVA
jgi:hypothetical protein